jgi:drug/metabolite transporter (DMT)-like permease
MVHSGPDAPATPAVGAGASLLAMVVIWALNFSIAKDALREIPPLAFNALRFPLAAGVVFAALRLRGPLPRLRRGDAWKVAGSALLGNVIYQQFFILGLARTRAGTASVLLAGAPIMTALFSVVAGHERVPLRAWLGVLATFAGIALVVLSAAAAPASGRDTLAGTLLLIAATVAWAAYTVGSRGLVQRYGSLTATAYMLWAGTCGIVLIGVPELVRLDAATVSARSWLAVVYAGALSIGLAYLIWHHGVKQIGNTRTAVYSNLVPVLALAAAWLTLGEVPSAGQVVGAAVIITGVTLTQVR